MNADALRWRTRDAALWLDDMLSVSFQRYLIGAAPPIPQIPQSLGRLDPVEVGDSSFVIPFHDGEAAWIAAEFLGELRAISIGAADPGDRSPVELGAGEAGAPAMIAGIEGKEGPRRFAPPPVGCETILIRAVGTLTGAARVRAVDPRTYLRLTGNRAPPPARARDGYQGWLLP